LKIFRLTKTNYINDLSGEGARLYSGRWNRRGDALLYFSENLSLCVLELLTRIDFKFLVTDYSFLEAEIPSSLVSTLRKPEIVTEKWRNNPPISHTQDYGSIWIRKAKSLALKVPSAVLPNESNILINPNHKYFYKVKIIRKIILDLDARVFV